MTILKIISAIILATSVGYGGSLLLAKLYEKNKAILSFPEKVTAQQRLRPILLISSLVTVFSYQFISLPFDWAIIIMQLTFSFFLLLYTVSDWEQQVIFDVTLIPFALLGFFNILLQNLSLNHYLGAAIVGGLIFLLLAIITRGGIGGGDIKLIAALGLWLGPYGLLTVATIGFMLGGVAALLLLVSGRKKRTDVFAYGPFFTLTALVYSFLH